MRLPNRKGLLLSAAATLATLLFFEVALRTHDLVRGYGFSSQNGSLFATPMPKIVPFRTFGFDPYVVAGDETRISDRWGRQFPLTKPAGTYRIVCFGGSTTENRVGDAHYPALLQEELRRRASTDTVEVLNVGNVAYSTPHSIILLAIDVISWQPDLVILSHNINDLLAMYWPGFRMDYWNKYTHAFYTHPDYAKLYTWNNVIFQHSRLYWFLYHRIGRIREGAAYRSPDMRSQSYDRPRLDRAASVFERNLKTFTHIAGSHGIRVVLGTQPLERSEAFFQRHMAHKPYNDVVVYPPHDQFLSHHAAYNRVIREVAKELGAGLVDNDTIFGGDIRFFSDFVHYTRLGLDKLSDNYADAIANKYLATPGASASTSSHRSDR